MKGYSEVKVEMVQRRGRLLRLSGFLFGLIAVVTVWLLHEVGFLGYAPVLADEAGTVSAPVDVVQKALRSREEGLAAREAELNKRESDLLEREKALESQILSYKKTIDSLEDRLARSGKSEKDAEGGRAFPIYEKMEPKRAAKIFEKLEPKVAARLLSSMASQRAAEILGLMPPDRATLLTERHLATLGKGGQSNDSGQ